MRPVLILGETRTCMLQNSRALDRASVTELLNLVEGERVRVADRPVPRAVSPTRFTGVDCPLPTASQARCRGVGTVSARAVVTGGGVLQGSAYARVEAGPVKHRLPWSHYLGRPGVVQAIGRFTAADVATGFLADGRPGASIDLGAVSERLIDSVQRAPQLNHRPPLRARRTRLRWAAEAGDGPDCRFVLVDDTIRTVRLTVPAESAADLAGFCESLALHDWALTTLLTLVDRSDPGAATAFTRLRPAIVHLLHLWMPDAHVAAALLPLWDQLERHGGFSKQWRATRDRIRDLLALHTLGEMRNS